MPQWLRNAFAVEPPGPIEPTPREREVVERLAREVVRRGLTTPALFLLESCRPLNFIASQALLFFQPLTAWLFTADSYAVFRGFLERRGSVEFLCARIEEAQSAAKPVQPPR